MDSEEHDKDNSLTQHLMNRSGHYEGAQNVRHAASWVHTTYALPALCINYHIYQHNVVGLISISEWLFCN